MNKKFLKVCLITMAVTLFVPIVVQAFGLGDLNVNSALNQPFRGEIPIYKSQNEPLGRIVVGVAPLSEFNIVNVPRSKQLDLLRFSVIHKGGHPFVQITSQRPISDPILQLIIQAKNQYKKYGLVRQYTILLDPPVQTRVSVSNQASNVSKYNDYGPVQKNENLWTIAEKVRPTGSITTYQMVMALFKANPEAFNNGNLNYLRQGVHLQIPDMAAISQLSAVEAKEAFIAQYTEWKQQLNVPNTKQAKLTLMAASDQHGVKTKAFQSASTSNKPSQDDGDIKLKLAAVESQLKTMQQALSLNDSDMKRLQKYLQNKQAGVDKRMSTEPTENQTTPSQASVQPINQATPSQASVQPINQTTPSQASVQPINQPTEDTSRKLGDENNQNSNNDEGLTLKQLLEKASQPADSTQDSLTDSKDVNANKPDSESNYNQAPQTNGASVNKGLSDANTVNSVKHKDVSTSTDKKPWYYFDGVTQYITAIVVFLIILLLLLSRLISGRSKQSQNVVEQQEQEPEPEVVPIDESEQYNTPITPVETNKNQPLQLDEETLNINNILIKADLYISNRSYPQAEETLKLAREISHDNATVNHKYLFLLYKQAKAEMFVDVAKTSHISRDSQQWLDVERWGQELGVDTALLSMHEQQDDIEPSENTELPEQAATVAEVLDETVEKPSDTTEKNVENLTEDDQSSQLVENSVDSQQVDLNIQPTDSFVDSIIEENSEEDEGRIDFYIETDDDDDLFRGIDSLDNDTIDMGLSRDESVDTNSFSELVIPQPNLSGDDLGFEIEEFDPVTEMDTKLELAEAYLDIKDVDAAQNIIQDVLENGNEDQKNEAQNLVQRMIRLKVMNRLND